MVISVRDYKAMEVKGEERRGEERRGGEPSVNLRTMVSKFVNRTYYDDTVPVFYVLLAVICCHGTLVSVDVFVQQLVVIPLPRQNMLLRSTQFGLVLGFDGKNAFCSSIVSIVWVRF